MVLDINLNGIKNSLFVTYGSVKTRIGDWAGRGVSVVKSGMKKTVPYLQDRRIAVVTLIGLNLFLIEAGNRVLVRSLNLIHCDTSYKKLWRKRTAFVLGLGSVIVGVTAFERYGSLPLTRLQVAAISILTMGIRFILK